MSVAAVTTDVIEEEEQLSALARLLLEAEVAAKINAVGVAGVFKHGGGFHALSAAVDALDDLLRRQLGRNDGLVVACASKWKQGSTSTKGEIITLKALWRKGRKGAASGRRGRRANHCCR